MTAGSRSDAVRIDGVRSPMGKKSGSLSTLPLDKLRALVLQALVEPDLIGDATRRCVVQIGEQGGNLGRLAALVAGFAVEVGGAINRAGGSSLGALNQGAHAIIAGRSDMVIAAGMESMSRVPIEGDAAPVPVSLAAEYDMVPPGVAAERIAQQWGPTRRDLDACGWESHHNRSRRSRTGALPQRLLPSTHLRQRRTPWRVTKPHEPRRASQWPRCLRPRSFCSTSMGRLHPPHWLGRGIFAPTRAGSAPTGARLPWATPLGPRTPASRPLCCTRWSGGTPTS